MDIFGKTSPGVKKMSPLQSELSAKIKERNSQGLGADLTETEEEDNDDLLSMFNKTSTKPQYRSQSPYGSESRSEPPKPQARTSIGAKDSKPKRSIPMKSKNELDRLLADDDEDDMLSTQKKPWQPPQFKDFSARNQENRAPQPRDRVSKQSPLTNPRQKSPLIEEEDGSDEELAGAYTRQLQQRGSPFGRQTPIERDELSRNGRSSNSKSPLNQPERKLSSAVGRTTPKLTGDSTLSSGRATPKSKEDQLFGTGSGRTTPKFKEDELFGTQRTASGRATPKSKEDELFGPKSNKPKSNLDDIFGKRKSPSDQNMFSDRKSPKDKGKESPAGDRLQSKGQEGRQTPKNDPFSRKSPKQSSTLDDVFGGKKRVESPLFKSSQQDEFGDRRMQRGGMFDDELSSRQPQASTRQGSYMSKLLGDSDNEKDDERHIRQQPARSSYLNSLLGDEATDDHSKKPKTRTSYMDSLLDDEEGASRKSRPRERAPQKGVNKKDDDDERESSLCRDVDKDPMMIEKKKEEREQKRQSRKGKAQTESQQADFDIEEVSDAQDALAMTYIKPEQTTPGNGSAALKKPKARKKTDNETPSTPTFESAADIRNYIYKEWMDKKQASTKKTVSEKRKMEKEEQQKKEKELLDKKLENEATFRTWKERKDEMLKAKLRRQKAEEKKKEEELKKEQEKKQDAAIIFKKWKEEKDEDIIHKKRREKKGEHSLLTEKQEVEERKKKEAEGAFVSWKKKKDKEILTTMRQSKTMEKQEVTQKMTQTRRREIEAEKLYEQWLENKEKQKRKEKLKAKSRSDLETSPRPAWSPANKTIPYGR